VSRRKPRSPDDGRSTAAGHGEFSTGRRFVQVSGGEAPSGDAQSDFELEDEPEEDEPEEDEPEEDEPDDADDPDESEEPDEPDDESDPPDGFASAVLTAGADDEPASEDEEVDRLSLR
jgi:hypothetical protein